MPPALASEGPPREAGSAWMLGELESPGCGQRATDAVQKPSLEAVAVARRGQQAAYKGRRERGRKEGKRKKADDFLLRVVLSVTKLAALWIFLSFTMAALIV